MNYIQELGTRAIASRLKNFTELLIRDVVQIYKEQDIDFEPRWYTFFLLLSEKGEMSVMDISYQLNQSHPAVNQVANALEKKGLVISNKKDHDGRKRYLNLSNKGKRLLLKITPLWKDIEKAAADFILETDPHFLDNILQMEMALQNRSMYQRIQSQIKKSQYEQIRIKKYDPELKTHFKTLNYEWLIKFFTVEKSDEEILSNPESIIESGGNIYFAELDNKIVGTVAVIHHQSNVCELSKMAVTEFYQGKQIGRKLLKTVLDYAREKNYQKMILFSSPELVKAVNLYQSFGFVQADPSKLFQYNYNRCTIQMELNLNV